MFKKHLRKKKQKQLVVEDMLFYTNILYDN